MDKDKIVLYEDVEKLILMLCQEMAGAESEDSYDEDKLRDAARSWMEKLEDKVPMFEYSKKVKCMVCDKFQSKVNYCKLYEKEVGLFDSCKED